MADGDENGREVFSRRVLTVLIQVYEEAHIILNDPIGRPRCLALV